MAKCRDFKCSTNRRIQSFGSCFDLSQYVGSNLNSISTSPRARRGDTAGGGADGQAATAGGGGGGGDGDGEKPKKRSKWDQVGLLRRRSREQGEAGARKGERPVLDRIRAGLRN